MKNKEIVYCLSLFLFIAGCKGKSNESILNELDFTTIGEGFDIGDPTQIVAEDKCLSIIDRSGDSIVWRINPENGEGGGRLYAKGVGPGEMLPPVNHLSAGDSIYVYSRPTFTLYSAPISKPDSIRKTGLVPFAVSRIFNFDNDRFIASLFPFGDSGVDASKRFMIMDTSGKQLSLFGSYPRLWDSEKDYPDDVLASFHQTNSILIPDNSHIVAFTSNVMSVYKKRGDSYESVLEKIIIPYEYDYTPATANMSAMTNSRKDFGGVIVGACLYGDKIIAGIGGKKDGITVMKRFEVYDLEGNLERSFIPLEDLLPVFTVSKDGCIFSLQENENSTVLMKSSPLTISNL